MKHANVAIFVPHNGCPHQCSFCDQKAITGLKLQPSASDVRETIALAKKNSNLDCKSSEIAFFGGSFTAINREYMIELLDTAFESICDGSFFGIRISTRPDCITEDILKILKKRGVTSIELGAQSMDDEVLNLNNRGHSKDDVINSALLIKKYGFSLGLQMMTGLYGSNIDRDYKTAVELAQLQPDTIRIYPTIIMKNTRLGELYLKNDYKTYTLDQTINLCVDLLKFFNERNISVIRLGLHDMGTMKDNILDGPWHPALRELCEGKLFRDRILKQINEKKGKFHNIIIYTNSKCVSKVIGHKRVNIKELEKKGYKVEIRQDELIKFNDFKIEYCG